MNDDIGDDEVEVEGISPAIHQTCLHWAWEMKQDVLDEFWRETMQLVPMKLPRGIAI